MVSLAHKLLCKDSLGLRGVLLSVNLFFATNHQQSHHNEQANLATKFVRYLHPFFDYLRDEIQNGGGSISC